MLNAAIIPEGDAVRLPAEAGLKDRFSKMLVQKRQDVVTLIPRNLIDMRREYGIHKDAFATRDGVGADDRVHRTGIDRPGIIDALVAVAAAPDALAVVGRCQAVEISFHPIRQRVIRRGHAGK